MSYEIGQRLLAALAAAAEVQFGPTHALTEACRARDSANAATALAGLAPSQVDALLAEAHRRMREDGLAVLDVWRPTGLATN